MKKNGFTLIEILAVIVVLSVLGMIIVPIVNNQINESKEKVYNQQIEIIKEATELWTLDHMNEVATHYCDYYIIEYKQLIDGGYLDEDFVNPKTKEKFEDSMEIVILSGYDSPDNEQIGEFEYRLEIEDNYGYDAYACIE